MRTLAIAKIHPNAWNPNRLHATMREKLKRGVNDPGLGVLADLLVRPCHEHGDFEIVDGQHRWELFKELGLKDIEAKVADLDDDNARLAGQILNELRGEAMPEPLAALARDLAERVGIDRMAALWPMHEDKLRELAGVGPKTEEPWTLDEIAPRVKRGDVWALGDHRLMCGDSSNAADVARLVTHVGEPDFMFTSPPYNVGKPYESHDDREKDWLGYSALLQGVLEAWVPHLKAGRALGWNIGTSPKTYPNRQLSLLEGVGLTYFRTITWRKVGVPRPSWYMTRKVNRTRRFDPNYIGEVIYLVTKGPLELGAPTDFTDFLENDVFTLAQFLATRDVPEMDMEEADKEYKGLARRKWSHAHPAAFPAELPAAFIVHFADPGKVVADPFSGTGSTIIAAQRTGRVGCGIEIEPRYCDIALARWEKETGGKAKRIERAGGKR